MSDGFFFDGLTDFKKDLLLNAKELFPRVTRTFLIKEAKKLSKVQKSIAKSEVGTTGKNGDKSYHKKFKVGKIYNYSGDSCVRSFNSSPHGHLIENGHKAQDGSFVSGKYVIKKSQTHFLNEFLQDCDEFLSEHFDDIGD